MLTSNYWLARCAGAASCAVPLALGTERRGENLILGTIPHVAFRYWHKIAGRRARWLPGRSRPCPVCPPRIRKPRHVPAARLSEDAGTMSGSSAYLTSALAALSRDQSRSALPQFNWFILPDRAMGTLSRGQYGSRPHLRGLPLATVSDAGH